MNKRLKDKKMMSGIITAGGFLIILAGSALSQQTALGQNYQGVYVDGTFVGYVAENVDVKDVILQAGKSEEIFRILRTKRKISGINSMKAKKKARNWQKNLQAVYAWIMNGL